MGKLKNYILLAIPIIISLTGCVVNDEMDRGTYLTLSTYEISLDTNDADAREITVSSSENWATSISPNSAESWLSISPSSGDEGVSTATISISENGLMRSRVGRVVFTSTEGLSRNVVIEQPGVTEIFLEAEKTDYAISALGGDVVVNLFYSTGSYTYSIVTEPTGSWIRFTSQISSGSEDVLVFTVDAHAGETAREASIVFTSPDESLTETVTVTQAGRSQQPVYRDGDYILLQRATEGMGVDLIIMGDGYTENEINLQGIYERDIRMAMEDMFSVYPYDFYRNYFNVWMVVGVSNQSGPSMGTNMRDTKFGTHITGDGTEIVTTKENVVTNFAKSIPGISQDEGVLTVLLIMNTTEYAGTCIMYSSGYSISMCPRIDNPSPNFNARAIVIHECGGHGFGRLADEYSYGGTVPTNEVNSIRQWQTLADAYRNVDFTSNHTQVLWSEFFNYPKYTTDFVGFPIGVHEGALTYSFGAYRPEENSCMNDNIDYYNAPSRYEIVRRIMSLSGVDPDLTIDEFIEIDNPREPSYTLDFRVGGMSPGLGDPILRY